MNDKQRKILLDLKSQKDKIFQIEHPFDILIHSVLNTISLNELVQLYIKDAFLELKNSIYSNIEKRLRTYDFSEEIYENLKYTLESGVKYHESQRIRKVLENLLYNLDDDYKSDFFNTFFFSKYSNDKRAALKYINYSKKEIREELLREFLKSGNTKFLQPILIKKNIAFIAENIKQIWSLEPSFFFKKQIIRLLSKTKFDHLKFIEDENIDLFILACLITRKTKSKDAIKLLHKVPKEQRHFCIFNLSKELDFNDLKSEIEEYLN